MAKLKYGAVVADARGAVGGVVFGSGRFGPFVRRGSVPRRQQTAVNTRVRGSLANLARRWFGTLSQFQRDGWVALAAANPVSDVFGNLYALSGQQFYIRVNQVRFAAGLSGLDTAPADQSVTGIVTLSVNAVAPNTLTISFTVSPLAAGHRLYIFASPSLSPGRVATKRDMKFIGVSGLAIASPFNASSLYGARFGNMTVGKRIWVSVAVLRDDRGALAPALIASDLA